MRPCSILLWTGWVCALSVLVGTGSARASEDGTGPIWTAGFVGGYVRTSPVIDSFSTPRGFAYPELASRQLGVDSGFGVIGADFRLALRGSANVFFPFVGLRGGFAIGPGYRTDIATSNGDLAHIALRNYAWGELLLPGIGVKGVASDARIGVSVQLAVVAHGMRGALTYGPITSEFYGEGVSFAAYGDLFACPHAGRSGRAWGCLYAAPMIYTGGLDGPSGFLPGVMVGFRFDGER